MSAPPREFIELQAVRALAHGAGLHNVEGSDWAHVIRVMFPPRSPERPLVAFCRDGEAKAVVGLEVRPVSFDPNPKTFHGPERPTRRRRRKGKGTLPLFPDGPPETVIVPDDGGDDGAYEPSAPEQPPEPSDDVPQRARRRRVVLEVMQKLAYVIGATNDVPEQAGEMSLCLDALEETMRLTQRERAILHQFVLAFLLEGI